MTIERDDLIGAWRLHDFVLIDASGERIRPWHEDSHGLLMYTPDGFMSAAVVRIVAEGGAPSFVSYQGRFDLYQDRVVHHIEMSTDAALVGRSQARTTDFDGETLTLTASPSMFGGEGTTANIVWRRAGRR